MHTTFITAREDTGLLPSQSELKIPAAETVSPLAICLRWLLRPRRRESLWLDEFLLTSFTDGYGPSPIGDRYRQTPRLTDREQVIIAWLALVEGVETETGQRQGESLAVVRRLVRATLASFAPDDGTIWVKPDGQGENVRTATYLVVACLRLRHIDARPWLWGASPAVGRCLQCSVDSRTAGETPSLVVLPILGVQNAVSRSQMEQRIDHA